MFAALIATLLIAASILRAQAACGSWKTGTMSGYDNLDGSDDMHPGSVTEYSGTTEDFLENVPVASIYERDWGRYKYHNIQINYNGQIRTVQSWDSCADEDCPIDAGPQCCTNNAMKFANPGFLLDVERRTLSRLFGSDMEILVKVQYRICDYFDPAPVADRYGLNQ